MSTVLVVEDEALLRREVRTLLEGAGDVVVEAGNVEEAKGALKDRGPFDLIIADLRLPGGLGTDLLPLAGGTPVLLVTGYASVRSAVDAMKQGAADYLSKPFDPDELLSAVARLARGARRGPDSAPPSKVEGPRLLGESPAHRELLQKIARVAETDAPVLVLGESGTGKELVAHALHEGSARKKRPFVAVNCASIPDALVEAELFGSARGAFTGAHADRPGLVEAADGGTLFLDEVGELSPQAQARLLRFLQESEVRRVGDVRSRRVDVRVVAATHRDLPALVQSGAFRQDLYYRLRVVELTVPPLRERGADVLLLARVFVSRAALRWKRSAPVLSPAAERALLAHDWPGNVRELEHAISRATVMCGEVVEAAQLSLVPDRPSSPSAAATSAAAPTSSAAPPSGDASLEGYFVRYLRENQDQMNELELSAALGISRKTLWERRLKLGIPRPRPSRRG